MIIDDMWYIMRRDGHTPGIEPGTAGMPSGGQSIWLFVSFCGYFWTILGPSWDSFGTILWSSWDNFGVILGQF